LNEAILALAEYHVKLWHPEGLVCTHAYLVCHGYHCTGRPATGASWGLSQQHEDKPISYDNSHCGSFS